ncbi:hypothetical protein D3C81_2290350 [compost metagenome]
MPFDTQCRFQFACTGLQVNTQQARRKAADKHNKPDCAKQVGNGIGNGHVAIELGLGRFIHR